MKFKKEENNLIWDQFLENVSSEDALLGKFEKDDISGKILQIMMELQQQHYFDTDVIFQKTLEYVKSLLGNNPNPEYVYNKLSNISDYAEKGEYELPFDPKVMYGYLVNVDT